MARLIIPLVNSLKLLETAPQIIAQYMSKHMDDWMLSNRLNSWQAGSYRHPWLQSDSINLQLQTNTGQPQIQVINCKGTVFITELMIQRQQNQYEPDTFIYESATALATLATGVYWFKITTGSIILISEPIEVFDVLDNSLLVQYKHRKYYGGIIWETGIEMNFRIPGILQLKPPVSKDTLYEDQTLDQTMIKSVPYRLWNFIVGASMLVPDYIIDTLNRIFGCSSVRMDGRYYTKNDGFKWEPADDSYNHLLIGYRGELREMLNRNSKIVIPGTNTNELVTIMIAVDLKGFADTEQGGSQNVAFVEDVL